MAGETILIVEDSLLSRKLLQAVLGPHGYCLLTAVNGQEAIDVALRARPDLILMDMQLPKVNGHEATRVLRSRSETALTLIVALTAHAISEEYVHIMAAGCGVVSVLPIAPCHLPL